MRPSTTFIMTVLACWATVLGAQPSADSASAGSASAGSAGAEAGQSTAAPVPAAPRPRWRGGLLVTTQFDSNIEHEADGRSTSAGVVAADVEFRSRDRDPGFAFAYEIAGQRYAPDPEGWSRVSHHAELALGRALGHRWRAQTQLAASIRGSSDDRELNDQYDLTQRLDWRVARRTTLRAEGAYGLKRRDEKAARDGSSRRVFGAIRQSFGGGRLAEVNARAERNAANGEHYVYDRLGVGGSYRTPVGPLGGVQFGLKWQVKTYPHRFAEDSTEEDTDARRRDARWSPTLEWTRAVMPGVEVVLEYQFDARRSNDFGKDYTAHWLALTLSRRW